MREQPARVFPIILDAAVLDKQAALEAVLDELILPAGFQLLGEVRHGTHIGQNGSMCHDMAGYRFKLRILSVT